MSEPQPPPQPGDMQGSRRSGSPWGPFLVGAGMVAVGCVLFWQVFAIPAEGFTLQGPRFFPTFAVLLWLALAITYLIQHMLRLRRDGDGLPVERFDHMRAVVVQVAILVVYAYLLDPLGYWISTTVFFIASARTLGSRHLGRDALIGVLLSLGVYLMFTQALGVRLPEGVLGL